MGAAAISCSRRQQTRVRRPDHPKAAGTNAQAEVDVVPSDRQVLCVAAADGVVNLAPDRQARAGDGRHLPGHDQAVEIAGDIARHTPPHVQRVLVLAEDNSGMLDVAVEIVARQSGWGVRGD